MFKHKKNFELSPKLKFGVGRGTSHSKILKLSSVLCLLFAIVLAGNALRLLFSNKTTTSASTAVGQVLGASDTKAADDTQSLQFTEYKVQKGDTLFNVSQKNNINWATLATLNNLKSPFTLKLGQILKVPKQ